MNNLFQKHEKLLSRAISAIHQREYWSAYPEQIRAYAEDEPSRGEAAFKALVGKPFDQADQASPLVGKEKSPYGLSLNISYTAKTVPELIKKSETASEAWKNIAVEDRTGIALEILERLNRQSFLIGHAVQHTTGQAYPMAFQAGGPHAQDRGLEAVAYAYVEMSKIPGSVIWEKPIGRNSVRLNKTFRIVPRGVALVIGCATFPTWNSYPALFADLVTGNTVIIKPHPSAILPLAITVRTCREVFSECGLPDSIVQLAPDTVDSPVTKELVQHPATQIIDFTGSSAFGEWLRANAGGKLVYTEEAGLNSIVIDSTTRYRAMCQNIAFSLSLYSGQMCTSPRIIFVPKTGIETDEGHKGIDQVERDIAAAVDQLLSDPIRALSVTGAIQNPGIFHTLAEARKAGRIIRDSSKIAGPDAPTATPLIISATATDENLYSRERFGPVSFIAATANARDALKAASKAARAAGAITASLYSTDARIVAEAKDLFAGAGVPLSINFTGHIYVNQSAAFSDFHVSGANPAGNASLVDSAFVANRFRVFVARETV